MNYFEIERKAVYQTARIFTDYGWIFREKTVLDLGIDAEVETPLDKDGKIRVFDLQIKGGAANFHRSKSYLVFYFSERHYLYWNATSAIHPLLIIMYDPKTDKIYWELYTKRVVSKTLRHYKINIPLINILDESSKSKIIECVDNVSISREKLSDSSAPIKHAKKKVVRLTSESQILSKKQAIIKFRLFNEKRIIIEIICLNKKTLLNIDSKMFNFKWNNETQFLDWDDNYFCSISGFKRYIETQLIGVKTVDEIDLIFRSLKSKTDRGIYYIAEFVFDYENKNNSVPRYNEFIKAFEIYFKTDSGSYTVRPIDYVIHFESQKGVFEMSCYESQCQYLRAFLQNSSYDEIYTETNYNFWREIYVDAGIEKTKFIPVMLNEWEIYWQKLYAEVKERVGSTSHLDTMKETSLRRFESFVALYDDAEDIIELAYDFGDMDFYPIAVIAMLKIFDEDVCFIEYCELEFFAGQKWESISLNDDCTDSTILFIRPYDM